MIASNSKNTFLKKKNSFYLLYGLASFNIEIYEGVVQLSDLIKNILICVLNMNESLTRLEQHECE